MAIFYTVVLMSGIFIAAAFWFALSSTVAVSPADDINLENKKNDIAAYEELEKVDPEGCFDYLCFEKHYKYMVANESISAAFVDLKMRYDRGATVSYICHKLVHVIGRAASKKYPDATEAYMKGDHFCSSGYYHGVAEGFIYEKDMSEVPGIINSMCVKIPGREYYSIDYHNCNHGLGHGLMHISKSELFDALKLCDELSGEWERQSCYSGVFMENIIADSENHFTAYLKPEESLYPCTAVEQKYKTGCYVIQTSYVLKTNGYDFKNAFYQCSTVKEDFNKDVCYQSLGRDASGLVMSDIPRTHENCMLGSDSREQLNCVIGASKDIIYYYHSDVQAKEFCNTFSDDIKNTCLTTVQDYYRIFN